MDAATEENGKRKGMQDYPVYHALWPLQVMRILDPDGKPTDAWQPAPGLPKRTRVAVIDISVAKDHPNLEPAIDTLRALDLFSTRLGAFPYRDDEKNPKLFKELVEAAGGGLASGEETRALVREFLSRLRDGAKHKKFFPATGAAFSAHGTAIAGLVGARPTTVPIADKIPRQPTMELPFAGVDPFCEIVPISTSFDPDPEQLILALVYAELIRADVILLPRDFPDPFRCEPKNGRHVVEFDQREKALWDELETLIRWISQRRAIVCAAGNSGDGNVIYPASLASDDNGIIAVGAVNALGYRAAYSCYGEKITVMAPSSDGERFDREEVRLDTQDHSFDKTLPLKDGENRFSYLDVVSTDVPGRFGYNRSRFQSSFSSETDAVRKTGPDPVRDFGSYFCKFGGTSAASALVAGFISLGFTTGNLPAGETGPAVKRWLLEKSRVGRGQEQDEADGLKVPAWSGSAAFPPPEVRFENVNPPAA